MGKKGKWGSRASTFSMHHKCRHFWSMWFPYMLNEPGWCLMARQSKTSPPAHHHSCCCDLALIFLTEGHLSYSGIYLKTSSQFPLSTHHDCLDCFWNRAFGGGRESCQTVHQSSQIGNQPALYLPVNCLKLPLRNLHKERSVPLCLRCI